MLQLSERLKPFEELADSFYRNMDRQEGLAKLVGDFGLLRGEVYQEVSLACHQWKNLYMTLGGLWASRAYDGQVADVWEMLEKVPVPAFSVETWKHYSQLFVQGGDVLRARLDKIQTANADLLPPSFRKLMIDTERGIETQKMAYLMTPQIIERGGNKDALFEAPFREMVRILAKLSREADRLEEGNSKGNKEN